jgi:hypothetical protein
MLIMQAKIIEKIKDSKRIRVLSECLDYLRDIKYNHKEKIEVLALDYWAEYEEQFDRDDYDMSDIISSQDWIDMAESSIIAYLGEVIKEECSDF